MRPRMLMSCLPILALAFLWGCFHANNPPIASFRQLPPFGEAPLSVYFDAGDSRDADGEVVEYRWVFGDGKEASGVTATHTYADAGTYEAVLTITDDGGATGAASRMVDVRAAGATPAVGPAVGDLAPDFLLPNLLGGEKIKLSSLRGHIVLLDFWTSTCSSCRISMPHLEVLREEFAAEGLIVLAVHVDAAEGAARQFIEDGGFSGFLVVHDAEAAVKALYEVDAVPHTFLIDRQGVIRHADHPIRIRAWQIEPWL